LREAIKEIRQERANAKAAENQASVQNLSDVADFDVCVQGHPKEVFAQVAKGLVEKNNKDPKYFLMPDGQVHFFRPNDEGDQFFLEPTNGHDWRAELVESCFFYERYNNQITPASCPDFLTAMLQAKQHRHLWPPIERIATSPIFSKDGAIVTYKGYNARSKTLFWPAHDYRKVSPGEITRADLENARAILLEAVRDQPLTDCFGQMQETLPQYDGQESEPCGEDANGEPKYWPKPNLERGQASRANFIAACLTPYVREMIKGPTPLFVVDKRLPGTGGTLLCQTIGHICTGQMIATTALPSGKDDNAASRAEVDKVITSIVIQADPVVIFDNVEERLESHQLATVLTAERWNGRELGKSRTVNAPIKCMWLANGNRVQFHEDIMRRSVPIGIDAQCSNPALDRTPEDFKYNMNEWLRENHVDLAWACCVLVQNWLDEGRRPWSATTEIMGSYESWCRVIGGILEAAGIEGFLANRKDFLQRRTDDADPLQLMIQKLYDELKKEYRPFETGRKLNDLVRCWYDGDAGDFYYPFDAGAPPRDPNAAHNKVKRNISKWVNVPKSITTRGGSTCDVWLVKSGNGPSTVYYLKPVKEEADDE
jgi:hypothetical protein